jgi:hypothetical protein
MEAAGVWGSFVSVRCRVEETPASLDALHQLYRITRGLLAGEVDLGVPRRVAAASDVPRC